MRLALHDEPPRARALSRAKLGRPILERMHSMNLRRALSLLDRRQFLSTALSLGLGLGLALLGACTQTAQHRRPDGVVELVVLHTNDMHGQVQPRAATWLDRQKPPLSGGLPRVADFVTRTRREESERGRAVLVLDGGDWYQGTPEGVVGLGLDYVRAIAAVGYDAASIGNHEFDHGVDNLRRLLADARPPAICANLRERSTGDRVSWLPPWKLVDVGGLRFALVGLVTPTTPSITHHDARQFLFADGAEEIGRVKHELEGRYDVLLPIGHIGIDEAVAIAHAHPEIPLIVTGHSHTFLREGRREGDTLIVQAGAKASVVGRVELVFDGPTARVQSASARLVDLVEAPTERDRNPIVDSLCDGLVQRADKAMREVVGELAAPLTVSGKPYSTVAGTWIADLMRERMHADVGLNNRGGVRAEIASGPVTRRQVFEMSPFDNDVVRVELSGRELESIVREAINGTTHSGLDYSGCRIFVREGREKTAVKLEYQSMEVGGAPLDPDRKYTVATNSFLAGGGDGFDVLAKAGGREEDPILLRELVEAALRAEPVVTPPSGSRIDSIGSVK